MSLVTLLYLHPYFHAAQYILFFQANTTARRRFNLSAGQSLCRNVHDCIISALGLVGNVSAEKGFLWLSLYQRYWLPALSLLLSPLPLPLLPLSQPLSYYKLQRTSYRRTKLLASHSKSASSEQQSIAIIPHHNFLHSSF